MPEGEGVVTVAVTIYPKQQEILDQYAQEQECSRSYALRKIITEWAEQRAAAPAGCEDGQR